jgi:hypothetical protein
MKNKKIFLVVLFLLFVTIGVPRGCGSPTEPQAIYVVVRPESAKVQLGQTVDFSALIKDQYGDIMQRTSLLTRPRKRGRST